MNLSTLILGLSLRSNPRLKLANAFGVIQTDPLATKQNSKCQFQAKLNLPRWAGAENLSEVRREGEAVRRLEIRCVEEIENFSPKLQARRLAEIKKLDCR